MTTSSLCLQQAFFEFTPYTGGGAPPVGPPGAPAPGYSPSARIGALQGSPSSPTSYLLVYIVLLIIVTMALEEGTNLRGSLTKSLIPKTR